MTDPMLAAFAFFFDNNSSFFNLRRICLQIYFSDFPEMGGVDCELFY
jgi:hypothetical protein